MDQHNSQADAADGLSTAPRIALVTGGNRGIGLAIAGQLAERGMQVVIGCRDIAQAELATAQLHRAGAAIDCVQLDVTDEHSRVAAIDELLRRHGRIDILINNAGVALDQWVPLRELDIDILRETMETNLYGPLRLCQLVLPTMRRQGYGRIVNVSTELASLQQSSMGSTGAYRMSKTALNMLTRLLALELESEPEPRPDPEPKAELRRADILVNAAAPGWVRTALGGDAAPRTPAEGADTAVWLAMLPTGGPNGGFFRDRQPYAW